MLSTKFKKLADRNGVFFIYVILLIAFGMGTVVRLQFVSDLSFPINDGGLFYQMTEDLLDNRLQIPEYTTYNNDQIPYAYPPLAFYLIALIRLASGQPLLQLFRIFPLIISILTMLAFYVLVSKLVNEKIIAALSVLIFAMLPRAYEWFIMGGGVTRGLGFLFAIIALIFIWDLFSKKSNWMNLGGTIIFSSACVLSHPETALFVIFMAGVIFLFHAGGWQNIKKGLIVALGVIICILPWILTINKYHGLEPFLGAGGTGHGEWLEIKNFITLNFGFENDMFLTIISVLALIALFIRKDKITYYLSACILIGYFLFPRSGPNLLTLLVTPLSAFGFYEILILSGIKGTQEKSLIKALDANLKTKLIFTFIIAYLILGAFSYKYVSERDQLVLTDDLLATYRWLDENTEQDANIMFYPAAGAGRFWWNDFAAEWFPALTTRANLTTVQGYEWIEGEYERRESDYLALRTCLQVGPICVDNWEIRNNTNVDYLVIGQTAARQDFVENFLQREEYQVSFSGDDYVVLEKE